MSTIRRWSIGLAVAVGLVVVVVGVWVLVSLTTDRPVTYRNIEDHFKYGSIGSEPGVSLLHPVGGALPPYAVLTALPSICPEKLPGGYASLGFVFEPGHDLPIGISRRRRLGIDHVGLNCAVCHSSTVRDREDGPARVVLGMPAATLDLQAFVQFVLDCTLDNRLTTESLLGHVKQMHDPPSLFEQMLIRFGLVGRLKLETLELRNRIAPLFDPSVPRWGRGRVDTFNPYKAVQFNWRLDELPHDEIVAAADFPSLWNQKPREGMHLHWDGDNTSVDERNLSAALGAGVTPVTVDHASLKRIRDWIWTLPPPPYPYPIDRQLAARGAEVYRESCLACHADHRFKDGVVEGRNVGQVEDIDAIATDRHRLDAYTYVFAANQYALYPDSPYRFTHFRKTRGYANQPLDGIWLRAPYLHNGSVPTLRALLDPPDARPKLFYRGNDLFDRQNVGFVSTEQSSGGRVFFAYDTTLPGNGNGGHTYGTQLSPADKQAIVEYLKTF